MILGARSPLTYMDKQGNGRDSRSLLHALSRILGRQPDENAVERCRKSR